MLFEGTPILVEYIIFASSSNKSFYYGLFLAVAVEAQVLPSSIFPRDAYLDFNYGGFFKVFEAAYGYT